MTEITGYKLNGIVTRGEVDKLLAYTMPIWDMDDKDIYFIRGHIGGSLVLKLKELKVFDIWFIPVYKDIRQCIKEQRAIYVEQGIMVQEINTYCVHIVPTIKSTYKITQ